MLRSGEVTKIGVDFIDCIIFAYLRVIQLYIIKDRVLMYNLLLVSNAMFYKTILHYDNKHYSKIKTYQGVTQSHLKHCSESSVSLLS